jgi:excisionase family DNA binding protein
LKWIFIHDESSDFGIETMDALLTVDDVAAVFKVHPNTVYKKAKNGEIPSVKAANSRVRFIEKDIKEWLERRSRSSSFSPFLEESLRVDLSLQKYDKLFLKGGVKVSPKGKTWNYPFGSVYLRQSKSGKDRWHIYYRVEGKRIRKAVKGAQSRADALKVLQVEVADAFRGKHGFKRDEKKIRFTDFAAEYIESYAMVNKLSWKDDVSAVGSFRRYFGSSYLHEIGVLDIEKFKSERLKEGISRARVNRNLTVLKKALSLAVDWGYLKENPARRVKRFPENTSKERILREDEKKKFLEACAPHLRPIVLTALNTGMRRAEILSLRWDQVDLGKGTIRMERTKSGKTRVIPINSLLFSELKILKGQNGQSEYVFLGPKTKNPIKNVKTAFKAACRRSGIKGLRFHDLRHTAASKMVEAGIDLVTVSKILGHSTIQMTMRYAHPTPENMRRAVETLAQNGAGVRDFVPILSTKKESEPLSASITIN